MKSKILFLVVFLFIASLACMLASPSGEEGVVEPTETVEEALIEPTETSEAAPAGQTPTQMATELPTPVPENPLAQPVDQALNPASPEKPVKLIFIHHSSGENWLADESGGLGLALMRNNYFVSDTNYGWGPDSIGDTTDIGNWWTWFVGPDRDRYMEALFNESGQNSSYSRLENDPGGENMIIMFKSCFPNSALGGNPNDPPMMADNPLRGQDSSSEYHTVANAKGIYNDLLPYFRSRPDKLFILITAPPLGDFGTDSQQAANARALNSWLVEEWLRDYQPENVAVFDFYNVLTSNGGDTDTNDAGGESGNHHRFWNGAIQYITDQGNDYSAYAANDDSHPSSAGNQKATAEFTSLLNIFYHRWLATQP
jgi:hypothetical protein